MSELVAHADVIGLAEAAEMVGVSRQSLCNRLRREFNASPDEQLPGDFPRPFGHVSGDTTPIWDRQDVNAYLNMGGGNNG
jgi:hypothetical protein